MWQCHVGEFNSEEIGEIGARRFLFPPWVESSRSFVKLYNATSVYVSIVEAKTFLRRPSVQRGGCSGCRAL